MRKLFALWCVSLCWCACAHVNTALAQDAEGRPTTNRKVEKKEVRGGKSGPAPRTPAAVCDVGEIVVRCGMPGCEVSLDGKPQLTTDASGELRLPVPSGTHAVSVTKPFHEGARGQIKIACGETESIELRPKPNTVLLRIRTSLPECDIYVNNSPAPVGRSDAQGLFNYQALPTLLLVGAKKKGYLSQTERINLTPGSDGRELALVLEPIKASLTLSTNVEGARVQVDQESQRQSLTGRILLSPGSHRLTVDALGYAPVMLEVSVAPDEELSRSVTLQHLPATELARQAEQLYAVRSYADVLKLCDYMLKADGGYAPAHRLAGLTYLAQQDYVRAEAHLSKALLANETVRMPVRRHPRESFDFNKGHELCPAVLILKKGEVEFQGFNNSSDNFKAPPGQFTLLGIQLKKNTAPYLSTKVTMERGQKKDFNFYSFDQELSQAGRPYLDLLNSLLKTLK